MEVVEVVTDEVDVVEVVVEEDPEVYSTKYAAAPATTNKTITTTATAIVLIARLSPEE